GYITSSPGVSVGDVVLVKIDSDSSLSFSSSRQDSKNITLEFTGGETGNLFSFLPGIKSGDALNGKGNNSYSLKTLVATRVTNTDNRGKAQIQGVRSVSIDGKQESITVTGWIDPGDLEKNNTISFSRVADSRIIYTTILEPGKITLTAKDIKETLTRIPAGIAGTGGTTAASGAAGAAGTATTAETGSRQRTGQKTYSLTDSKKRELLLLYINKMIDLIF
ncbi:MAG: hypothetical protein DRP57_07265, partial [Spirochaetes bacterium]